MNALAVLRVGELLKKELRQMFRDVRMRGLMFGAPVIQLVIFGYAVNTDIRNTATFVVDLDRSPASRRFVDAFQSTGYFKVVGNSESPSDLVKALNRGSAEVGIEIPVGFSKQLARGGAQVQVVLDGTNTNTTSVAQGYAAQIVQRFALEQASERGLVPDGGIDLRSRAWYNPELESRVYNVPAIIGVLVLLVCLLLTALGVVRERELGTLDQLMVSPLTPTELMLGKTLPVTIVGLTDVAMISALAIFWFGIPMRGSIVALVLAALLYILAGLALGLFISTISRTQQEAFMSMFLVFLPAVILSGFFYPIRNMPLFFEKLTLLNPVRHFLEIVRAIFLKGEGLAVLWPQYLALAAMAGGVLWLATVRFRRTMTA